MSNVSLTHMLGNGPRLHLPLLAALVVGLAGGVVSVPAAHAATFTVDSTTDAVDANPADGLCATATGACPLQAANMEANALVGQDAISLPAGTYTLTLAGTGENASATGDLDVTDDFQRPDGEIGHNWHGQRGRHAYEVAGERLDVEGGGLIVWRSDLFGADQETFIRAGLVHNFHLRELDLRGSAARKAERP